MSNPQQQQVSLEQFLEAMQNEAVLSFAKTQQSVLGVIERQKQQLQQFSKIIEQKDAEIKRLTESTEKVEVAPNTPTIPMAGK